MGTGVEAGRAGAAQVGARRVASEVEVGHHLAQEEPRAVLGVQQAGVLAPRTQAGGGGVGAFDDGARVDVGARLERPETRRAGARPVARAAPSARRGSRRPRRSARSSRARRAPRWSRRGACRTAGPRRPGSAPTGKAARATSASRPVRADRPSRRRSRAPPTRRRNRDAPERRPQPRPRGRTRPRAPAPSPARQHPRAEHSAGSPRSDERTARPQSHRDLRAGGWHAQRDDIGRAALRVFRILGVLLWACRGRRACRRPVRAAARSRASTLRGRRGFPAASGGLAGAGRAAGGGSRRGPARSTSPRAGPSRPARGPFFALVHHEGPALLEDQVLLELRQRVVVAARVGDVVAGQRRAGVSRQHAQPLGMRTWASSTARCSKRWPRVEPSPAVLSSRSGMHLDIEDVRASTWSRLVHQGAAWRRTPCAWRPTAHVDGRSTRRAGRSAWQALQVGHERGPAARAQLGLGAGQVHQVRAVRNRQRQAPLARSAARTAGAGLRRRRQGARSTAPGCG